MKNRMSRGVALIMVAGVLSVLAAMATGFYVLMLMQTKSASHYTDSVRAEMMARAGVNYAVAQLRAQLFKKTEDPSNAWYGTDYLRSAKRKISFPDSPLLHNNADDDQDKQIDNPEEALLKPELQCSFSAARGNSANNPLDPSSPLCPTVGNPQFQAPSDRFVLNITDAAGKINVNAGDNLAVILDNLCRVIGSPLGAANPLALQPARWAAEMDKNDPAYGYYLTALNSKDIAANRDLYYGLYDSSGNLVWPIWKVDPKTGFSSAPMPTVPCTPLIDKTTGKALYGDGYAIASYRARNGAFRHLEEVKNALTYVERSNPPDGTPSDPLEQLEIEVKFAAIRDYITISSWVDTNTVCVGKFEWVHVDQSGGKTYAIDRDKSWVIDDPVNDPLNLRGSLRGCYLSIMNGHGAGQLRRIRTNGIDWVEVETPSPNTNAFTVTPGPISSYMIVSNEEAMLVDVKGSDVKYSYPDNPPPPGMLTFPKTLADGTLVRNPKMDYSQHPLCIHRAPVNVNTASDKVLEALFLGINVQHGHPLALGTDADVDLLRQKWKAVDIHGVQPYVLTPAGLKRLPAAHGWPVLDLLLDSIPLPAAPKGSEYDVAYLHNSGTLGKPNFVPLPAGGTSTLGLINDAHVLAYRIIMARQTDPLAPTLKYLDANGCPTSNSKTGQLRGPFKNYDDLYFRVIKPWDDKRLKSGWVDVPDPVHPEHNGIMDPGDIFHKARLAPMLMANFNSKAGILKFNPNIEWIDRWGRNFTEQEPVMVYTNAALPGTVTLPAPISQTVTGVFTTDVQPADNITATSIPIYTCVADPNAKGYAPGGAPAIESAQRNRNPGPYLGKIIPGAYITRSFRYKSDEMIDKTDLNRSTTEFSFDSNGIFEIISTGQIVKNGAVLAERKFAALVKIYDVWRESTQQQFVQGTISKAVGDRGTAYSGQLARDASGLVERKGLVTLPEPLLPLKARITDDGTAQGKANSLNKEVVTTGGKPLDAWGQVRSNPYDPGATPEVVPDVLANHILPARYDGAIALATNTSKFDSGIGVDNDEDTFLASFDGDLDTATCMGNGREQAKWPYSAIVDAAGNPKYTGEGYKHRCVHTIGLLGLLNDTLVAMDPGLPLVDGKTPFTDWGQKDNIRLVYPFFGVSSALMPLKPGSDPEKPYYWNNVTLRMGDLRTDGAYLSAPGVAGNSATLKYLFTPSAADRHKKLNFQPDSERGNCISMWAKSTWHHDDMRNHEFFNPMNEGVIWYCYKYYFQKMGQYKWSSGDENANIGECSNRRECNDLLVMAGRDPYGSQDTGTNVGAVGAILHGGYSYVDTVTYPQSVNESPGYYVQPFRWSFLGYRVNYQTTCVPQHNNESPYGHWAGWAYSDKKDWQHADNQTLTKWWERPFIDTASFPEGYNPQTGKSTWKNMLNWSYISPNLYGAGVKKPTYCTVGNARDEVYPGTTSLSNKNPTISEIDWKEGQDVKWAWADPYGTIVPDPGSPQQAFSLKSFGMNNLNYGNRVYTKKYDLADHPNGTCSLSWHGHHMPEDGTYCVIDEFKISNKTTVMKDNVEPDGQDWTRDRVFREMYTSRYYLPPQPGTRAAPSAGGPPTFTSQTLLHSLKGVDVRQGAQNVAVVRVNWDVFTPRFMCEYKLADGTLYKRKVQHTHLDVPWDTQANFKGPFDYVKYNDDQYNDGQPQGEVQDQFVQNLKNKFFSISRPPPWAYQAGQAQSGRGVEIELLKDTGGGANPTVLGGKTFTDPTAINALGTVDTPVWVYSNQLRYRVRFCYPVDPLVDPSGGKKNVDGKPCVDPDKQYLLDTPIFDDISITYIVPTRMLDFHEVTE